MERERVVNGLHVSQEQLAAYARTLAAVVIETDEVEVVFSARIETVSASVEVEPGVYEVRTMRRVVIEPDATPEVNIVRGVHEAALPWPEQVRRMTSGQELAASMARDLKATTALPKAPWEVAADAATKGQG